MFSYLPVDLLKKSRKMGGGVWGIVIVFATFMIQVKFIQSSFITLVSVTV
jgi:hypothetical protein